MNIFRKIRASLRLTEAIKRAEQAFNETGERYYVMPTTGNKGELVIMDRRNFRKMKQKGYIYHDVKVTDLERECFYCTSYRNGDGFLPDFIVNMKRKEYYRWIDNIRKNGKIRKH